MKRRFDEYERLHKGGPGGGSMWLAPDHLLVIEARGFFITFREAYRRFDYDRIQGVYWSASRAPWVLSTLLGMLAAVMAWVTLWMISEDNPFGGLFFGAITGVVVGLLVWDISLGSRGSLRIQTAAGNLRLVPVKRVKVAARVAAALAERCREAQDVEPTEEAGVEGAPDEAGAGAAAPVAGAAGTGFTGPVRPPVPEKWVDYGFWGAVVSGVLAMGELAVEHWAYSLLFIALLLLSAVSLLIGAARHGFKLGMGIGVPFWLCMAMNIVFAGIGYVVTIITSMGVSNPANIYIGALSAIAMIPGQFVGLAYLVGVCAVVLVVSGIWGAGAVGAARRARARFEVEMEGNA